MDSSGVVFEFISVVLAVLILHNQKVMYLSFYWGISAHLLTVMSQMMLRRVHEYGCLDVIQVL